MAILTKQVELSWLDRTYLWPILKGMAITFRHFLRNPVSQRLPRKFKINFSGCVTDCGQAMFNDVGAVAVTRRKFRVYSQKFPYRSISRKPAASTRRTVSAGNG